MHQGAASTTSETLTGSPQSQFHPEKDTHSHPSRPSTRHTSTSTSSSSNNSDPLSPLEHALAQTTSIPHTDAIYHHDPDNNLTHTRTGRTSITSAASRPPDYEVTISLDDPEHPRNWPLWYRIFTIITVSYATWVVVLYSTSYTATLPKIMDEFNITSKPIATLGLTTYLLGLAAGSVIVAPMSELYGRRPVYLVCLALFTVLIIPCGLADSLSDMIIVPMISNSPGTVVDISSEQYLALCMSLWSIAPLNGPVTGPLIGGFVNDYLGWRWGNWLAMILAGVAFFLIFFVKETYLPSLIKAKAAKKRKETGDEGWWCKYDERSVGTWGLLKLNLSRPFILAATEPILWFFNIWYAPPPPFFFVYFWADCIMKKKKRISVIYGILYLCFIAYPIIFTQHRGWSPSLTGLSFLGIGLGAMISICLEPFWRKLINSSPKRDPMNPSRPAPEATALIMCVGAVLTPIGQLIFSWTSLPAEIHPGVSIVLGSVPFGMGNTLSFIYGSNYLAGAYGIYAASALAGNAVMRSVFGAVLPLAGPGMYEVLGPRWAGTLLGGLEVVLVPIPFVFYRWGDRIRGRSRVIRLMREEREREEKKVERRVRREGRRVAGREGGGAKMEVGEEERKEGVV
ncbi:major facilitator superfamily domain-containing protein [Triangularia verruculosa]|uniref:Major facilitator superfamily domain-containing protein n=1 Tax=Triangularia verruculosa TaxID=2587418 RepID=A0AAN7AXS2_9PEZI|nr:major facilitator superfamily domain-containing protein [Triangularia verruculosa]